MFSDIYLILSYSISMSDFFKCSRATVYILRLSLYNDIIKLSFSSNFNLYYNFNKSNSSSLFFNFVGLLF